MLVDQKKLSWDIPIKKYFPDFEMKDNSVSDKVTFKDLFCHRLGIPRQEFFRSNYPVSRKEIVKHFKYFEPVKDFRYGFQYSNMAYTAGGALLAQMDSTNWEDFISSKLFKPLGMNSTQLSVNDMPNTSDYAYPYIDWESEPEVMDFFNSDILGPAGGIISNVEDMSKWVKFNLNNGKLGEQQLISPRSMGYLKIPQVVFPSRRQYKELSYVNYGLGWFIDSYRGFNHVHHGGVLFGYSAMVSMLPEENLGIVILANLNGTPFTTILEYYIYDRLLQLEPVEWNQRYVDYYARVRAYYENLEKEQAAEKKKAPLKPSVKLKEFVGKYSSLGYGSVVIKEAGDSLNVILSTVVCPLNHINENSFEIFHPVRRSGWEISFNLKDEKNVSGFDLTLGPGLKKIRFEKSR